MTTKSRKTNAQDDGKKAWKTNARMTAKSLEDKTTQGKGDGAVEATVPVQAVSLGGDYEGLPEFDAVAFGIGDPGEAAVVEVFAVGVDGDACGGELGEEGVEVVDTVVDHGLLGAAFVALAEVGGVFGEEGPDGHAGS